MYYHSPEIFGLILASSFIYFTACTSHEVDRLVDTGDETPDADGWDTGTEPDSGPFDSGVHDADVAPDVTSTDADTGEDAPVLTRCDDEPFEKPTTSATNERPHTFQFSPFTGSTPKTTNYGPVSRDHMWCTGGRVMESWLYPGEYFVIDHSNVQHNVWWVPSDYHAVVLLNGEPIPFALERVPDFLGPRPFPSMDEIMEWSEDRFDIHHVLHVPEGTPVHYTLVIPPWAFPDIGAYNIQVLRFPVWEPTPNQRYLASAVGPGVTTSSAFHYMDTHTVYYGDTCVEDHTMDYPDRTDEAEEWDSLAPSTFVARLNFQFLAPPSDVCDWTSMDWPDGESCLSETLIFDEPTASLEFYVAGLHTTHFTTDTRGLNLYHVMRDHEVIDSFLLDPGDADYPGIPFEGKKGVVLPVEVPLTEEPAAYQIIGIPRPFKPHIINSDDPYHIMGFNPVNSNSLLLKYEGL